jgi:hypothetical protein
MPRCRPLIGLTSLLLLSGCASLFSAATADLSEGLSSAVLDNEDVEGVRDGAPAFLLLVDGLLAKDADNVDLLRTGARLNSAYVTAFVDDPSRQRLLSEKALTLAERAVCLRIEAACAARTQDFATFSKWVERLDRKHVGVAYDFAAAWAGWIQARSGDWDAIAELSRPKTLMMRMAAIDDTHDHGGAELYLGVFETLLPPALGGRPEVGRAHFERAVELSDGKYLLAKVMFAQRYARLVFDRELHDRLLNEVLETDPRVPGLTLLNLFAQEQARQLLGDADEYF